MAAAAPALVAAVAAGVVAAHPAGTTADGRGAPQAAETTTCPLRLGAQLRLGPRPADTGDATSVLGYALTVTNASSTAT